ncbi:helix-turn-helix domain-containing protein [Streptomyces sp. CA-111067]|uniref:helix-turn-helix domain-containing protein n=1 Tax=Streptomyces sp. CA-111067 TaxID=3240046 RepID=UPI003D95A874
MPLRTDGAALRERRTLKGLTIVEFAQLISYSQNHVSQVELGRLNAGPQFLRAAADILNCSLGDITNGVIPRKNSRSPQPKNTAGPSKAVA